LEEEEEEGVTAEAAIEAICPIVLRRRTFKSQSSAYQWVPRTYRRKIMVKHSLSRSIPLAR
jgi:hypothetical protein